MLNYARTLNLAFLMLFILLISLSAEENISYNNIIKISLENGNIYALSESGRIQLTSEGKDVEAVLSPDKKTVIFVRHIKECPFTYTSGWFAADFDEIWSMNIDGTNQRPIIKNNFSESLDMDNYLGCFDNLRFSPDSSQFYFLSQNSRSSSILYKASVDGSNIKKLGLAHQIDIMSGSPDDEYYGYIVAGIKRATADAGSEIVMVLLDIDGNEVREINSIQEFWKTHKMVE